MGNQGSGPQKSSSVPPWPFARRDQRGSIDRKTVRWLLHPASHAGLAPHAFFRLSHGSVEAFFKAVRFLDQRLVFANRGEYRIDSARCHCHKWFLLWADRHCRRESGIRTIGEKINRSSARTTASSDSFCPGNPASASASASATSSAARLRSSEKTKSASASFAPAGGGALDSSRRHRSRSVSFAVPNSGGEIDILLIRSLLFGALRSDRAPKWRSRHRVCHQPRRS